MKLELQRKPSGLSATLGSLSIDGQFTCFTLEDIVREVPGQPVEGWKIAGETAIPAGTYDVEITWSVHFQQQMPQLLDVPGFEGVRIHFGNTDKDTEGCILVGESIAGDDFIANSRNAYASLLKRLDAARIAGDPISIEIRSAS